MEDRSRSASGVLWGRVVSVIALVFCVPAGLYFVSIAMEFVGIVLGVVGYSIEPEGSEAWRLCSAWGQCS